MTIVVDASVAIKWVLEEEGSEAARRLLVDELLVAPDLLIVECANILWKAAQRSRTSREQAATALAGVQALPVQLVPSGDYVDRAQALAFELPHSVYDCLYLAVALAQRSTLITADRKFAEAIDAHGTYFHAVRVLDVD